MKHIFSILLLTMFLTSCNDKTVLLPETTNADITKILDVSPVYMFYDETQPDSIEFNRKNMINTTNWLVNIDKRLTLKQLLPHLQYLQEKRHGDGMHTNKNAKNYFSCSNTDLKNLSFIEFTDVIYREENFQEYSSKKSTISNSSPLIINVKSKDNISFIYSNEIKSVLPPTKINNLIKMLNFYTIDLLGPIEIVLAFNSTIDFQDYITIKTQVIEFKKENVVFAKNEFIIN